MCQCFINCLEVSLYHCLATFSIGLLNTLLDLCDSLFLGKNAADREEASLHNCIDTPSHTNVTGNLLCINYIEAKSLVKNRLLYFYW